MNAFLANGKVNGKKDVADSKVLSLNNWLNNVGFESTANISLAEVYELLCHVGHPGEMFTSSAPYDPIFWSLHGLAERFLSFKRLMAADNKTIGRFHLADIPPAPRGVPQIEVTFDIDANGIINVGAKDKATGKEQSIKIEASSGLSDDEIARMKADAEANADADAQAKERADVLNQADGMVFQTEKQLKEFGDKIPAEKMAPINEALENLKKAHAAQDVDACKAGLETLNTAFQAASQEMYAAQQEAGGDAAGAQGQRAGETAGDDAEVTDVDFEEVKDN